MDLYVEKIIGAFSEHKNPQNAVRMKAYMKNKFDFLGIKSPERRAISKPVLTRAALPEAEDIFPIIQKFWDLPHREYQYFAMELITRYKRHVTRDWIRQYELMIISKSWWDTVDYIAGTLVGYFFMVFPDYIHPTTSTWMQSNNIWLQRSCLLFQLKYKNDTNTELLSGFIEELSHSKEFFIAKAIGWALREYSKSNPDWVRSFVENHSLQPLSRREAIKRI